MIKSLRVASAKGLFYPLKCAEIQSYFEKFNRQLDAISLPQEIKDITAKAVIVPHAGYIYSGYTANMGYHFLKKSKAKRVIIIGPSHHHYFKGISGSYYEAYETPCGNIPIDSAYLFALAKKFNIIFEPNAHKNEHSTEVQIPFIKHYLPQCKIIELIYSDIQIQDLANMMIALLNNKDNLLIISSDLSHFHTLKEAKEYDYFCLKAVEKLDNHIFQKGCKACGGLGIQALISTAKQLHLSSKLLDYRTSANANKDESSVVGYMSALFYW